ncbi:hypothetical protein C0584_02905 [Candidatus Parcubacteria bacterium]|nr:MAG: hypothetical protein C0584_02905 [Candidatus Parcubacteria bacterium]
MSIYYISILFNGLGAALLSIISWRKKGGGEVYRNFSYLLLVTASFYLTLFGMQFVSNSLANAFFARFLMAWMIVLPFFTIRSVMIFLGKRIAHKKRCIAILILVAIYLIANFYGLFIESVGPKLGFANWPLASANFEYYNIFFFALMAYAFYMLYLSYSQAYIAVKQRIRYSVIAIFVFYISLIIDLYLWHDVSIPPFGNLIMNALFLLVFYFLLSKRIIDFKLAIRKSTVTVSSLLLMFVAIIGARFVLARFILDDTYWDDYALLVLAILIYPILKERLFKVANRFFFTSLYDPGTVITKFNKNLRSIIEIDEIFKLLDKTFSRTFHNKSFGLLFYDSADKKYSISYNSGFDIYSDVEFESDSMLFRKFIEQDKVIIMSKLLKDIQFQGRKMVKIFEHFGIELVIPLVIKDRVLGVIVVTGKKSGDAYNKEDIGVLDVISSQATVAIDNALKYEEIKKFKFKLEREVKRSTQELRVVNEELKRVDADKTGFISIASHQLRTPLTVIKGYASMLIEDNFGKLEETTTKAMKKVFISSERLIELVEDLLDISRIESGRQTYQFKEGQLEDLIDSMIDSLAMSAESKKVKLIWEKPKKPLPSIKLDKEKLRQSCMNLIENAIKYTSKAERSDACVKVTIEENEKKKILVVKVKDNGLGITQSDMKNLFTKFYRGHDRSIAATEGTGLGLYIAKQIVEEHGGSVEVKSAGEGKGAEFIFWIPIYNNK